MIKMILAFMAVFAIIYIGIEIFGKLNKKERSALTKTIVRVIIVAELSLAIIAVFVMLF